MIEISQLEKAQEFLEKCEECVYFDEVGPVCSFHEPVSDGEILYVWAGGVSDRPDMKFYCAKILVHFNVRKPDFIEFPPTSSWYPYAQELDRPCRGFKSAE